MKISQLRPKGPRFESIAKFWGEGLILKRKNLINTYNLSDGMVLGITVAQLKKKLVNKEDFILLDVREAHEVDLCSIQGSIHVPISEIQEFVKNVDKKKEIVVYCHTGGRSAFVTHFLKEDGFNAKNLLGGIDDWAIKIDKKMKRY
jgi:rhodanese-related sulfurtransferase